MNEIVIKKILFYFFKHFFKVKDFNHCIFLNFHNKLLIELMKNFFNRDFYLFRSKKQRNNELFSDFNLFKDVNKNISKLNYIMNDGQKKKYTPFRFLLIKNFDNLSPDNQQFFKCLINKIRKNYKFFFFPKNFEEINESILSRCFIFECIQELDTNFFYNEKKFQIKRGRIIRRKTKKLLILKNINSYNNGFLKNMFLGKKFFLKLFFNLFFKIPNEFSFFFLNIFKKKKTNNNYLCYLNFFLKKKYLKISHNNFFLFYLLKLNN
jgi:hypothetical protein